MSIVYLDQFRSPRVTADAGESRARQINALLADLPVHERLRQSTRAIAQLMHEHPEAFPQRSAQRHSTRECCGVLFETAARMRRESTPEDAA